MSVIFNGKFIAEDEPCIRHNDRGFTLGHGFFETILIDQGIIPFFKYHWQRLQFTGSLLGITIPFEAKYLKDTLLHLYTLNGLQQKKAVARCTVSDGESERGLIRLNQGSPNFIICVQEYKAISNEKYSALIVKIRKNEHNLTSRIKSISNLENILAKQEAHSRGYDEAILLNTNSNIADGSYNNIFMVKDEKIFTPPIADGALPGVFRSYLLSKNFLKFKIIEKTISEQELLSADEIFLTNALIGVRSVIQLNEKKFTNFLMAKKIKKELALLI